MAPGDLQVEVVPFGPDAQTADAAVRAALEHPAVRAEVEGVEHRVLSLRPVGDAGADPPTAVEATIYDYTHERAVVVDVPLNGAGAPRVASTARQPLPTEAERRAALAVLRDDPKLGPPIRDGRLVPYRPMPPLLGEEEPDRRLVRAVTVGLRPAEADGAGHEIVAVPSRDARWCASPTARRRPRSRSVRAAARTRPGSRRRRACRAAPASRSARTGTCSGR